MANNQQPWLNLFARNSEQELENIWSIWSCFFFVQEGVALQSDGYKLKTAGLNLFSKIAELDNRSVSTELAKI